MDDRGHLALVNGEVMFELARPIGFLLVGALALAQTTSNDGAENLPAAPPSPSATSIAGVNPTPLAASSAAPAASSTAPAAPSAAGAFVEGWSYEGKWGPANWPTFGNGNPLNKCGGTRQSPVNLLSQSPVIPTLRPIVWNYKSIPLKLIHTPETHTIGSSNTAESYITIEGGRYDLNGFHFHSPSQHTINGKAGVLELDLVHFKSSYGSSSESLNHSDGLAVVALVFEIGKDDNAALKPIWDNMPMLPTGLGQTVNGGSMNLANLLPKEGGYYHYPGSLTTPWCNENVSWFVLSHTVAISEAQLAKFHLASPGPTNRPVQPLNGRTVIQFKP